MKQIFLFLLLAAGLGSSAPAQTAPLYENRGIVDSPVNIDAIAFLNGGAFDVSYSPSLANAIFYYTSYGSLELFETDNTLYYTNLANASMTSSGGFNFYCLTNGFQKPAAVFENFGQISGQIISLAATNIVSSGVVRADGGGLVKFTGQNVDLSRGGIAAVGSGGYSSPGISYSGETPIYYGLGVGDVLEGDPMSMTPATFSLPDPSSPIHWVNESAYQNYLGYSSISTTQVVPLYYSRTNLTGFSAFANTNRVNSTSEVVQVVFVNTNAADTNIIMKAGFVNSSTQMPGNLTAVVEWKLPGFDAVAGVPLTNYLYFTDRFGTQTNAAYRTNFAYGNLRGDITGVNSYNIYRSTTPVYYNITNNAVFDSALLNNPAYTNTFLTNAYIAYGTSIGTATRSSDLLSYLFGYSTDTIANPALSDPTNQPARIEINAGNLDISYSRLQADNMLMVNTTNLISLEGMVLDSPVVKYNVGSTNSTLVVSNFVVKSVSRLLGDIYAYSAVFTNGYSNVDNGVTNDVEVRFHVLILDHYMKGTTPVDVYSLIAKATNIVVQDDLYVSHVFQANADSIDIRGSISGAALDSSSDALFPRLMYLTNNGTFSTVKAPFIGERITNMQDVVNHGKFSAQGLSFKANSLLNDGTLSAGSGSMVLHAKLAKLDQGILKAGGDITITASEVKARNSLINAGSINLNVTNLLSDASYRGGSWTCSNGFNLNIKPASGDLLGTAISESIKEYAQAKHKWAGEDRGRSVAGFSNNAAIGKLSLTGERASRFNFSGASTVVGQSNALYVDYLELNKYATNVGDGLVLSSNMTIYFAAANLPVEQLDGKLNGRLKWVSSFAGPYSSTNITLANGQTMAVNLALLTSAAFDSDADGLVNSRDSSPFDGARFTSITVTNLPSLNAQISWNGAGQTAYKVEYTTNIFAPTWLQLTNVVNDAVTNKVMSVLDVPAAPGTQRYYRVTYTP